MARLKFLTQAYEPAAADDDGVFANQTLAGAGYFTLNGALVSGGEAILDSTGKGGTRQLLFTHAGNDSARTITVRGRLVPGGDLITETLAGGNAGTVTTTRFFYSVKDVALDGATAGNVKCGTNGVGATPWLPLNHRDDSGQPILVEVDQSGTMNWTLQYTLHNPNTKGEDLIPYDDATLAAKTADDKGTIAFLPAAIRIKHNSFSATATVMLRALQAGV